MLPAITNKVFISNPHPRRFIILLVTQKIATPNKIEYNIFDTKIDEVKQKSYNSNVKASLGLHKNVCFF